MTTAREFRRAQFSITSLAGSVFEGFTDGNTWNGWACPYFTRKVAVKVLEASRNNGYLWSYDAEADAFVVRHRDDPEDFQPERFDGFHINLDNEEFAVYSIGAYSWIWEFSGPLQT